MSRILCRIGQQASLAGTSKFCDDDQFQFNVFDLELKTKDYVAWQLGNPKGFWKRQGPKSNALWVKNALYTWHYGIPDKVLEFGAPSRKDNS